MPVAPITYLYLILIITSVFSIPLAVYYRNWERLGVIFICILLFAIGLSAN